MVYKWYILPIGGLYGTYHLLMEPETTIERYSMISMIIMFSFSPAEKKTGRMVVHPPKATCWTSKYSHHFRRNVCRRVEGERTTNDNELILVPIRTRNHVQESSPGWFPHDVGKTPISTSDREGRNLVVGRILALGGGFKYFFIFIPIWGRFPILTI